MFYGTHEGVFMCASIPQALHRAGMPAILDVEYSAATFAMAEASLDATMFKGIRRLGPGEAITFSMDGAAISRTRIWHPDTQVQRAPSPERVFEIVEKAVTAALRRSRGLAATQLSAGRDSGLITTMAARHEPHLVAFTAAPSRGFFDSGLPHFLQDESELAGTVARWCGARHHVVRTVDDSSSFMETVRRFHATSARSVLNVRNVFWWDGIGRAASATGASILLTGSIGNLTVSAGGVNALGDVRREEGLGRWWPLAQKLALLPDVDWKTVANQSFPVLFPARVRRGLRKLARRPDRFSPGRNLFRQDFQERVAAIRAEKGRYDQRFYHEERAQALEVVDLEERTLAAHYGLSVRDPTADLRVAKLFLGMPAIDLVSEKGGRPLFDRCFGPLFPPEWHDERRRGLQSADWMEQFRPNDLLETLEEIETSNLARELIDLPYAQQLLQRWVSVPTTPAEQLLYSGSLLEALAFGLFVKDHF
ncbi:asparagine synthase-related protein [Sphingomonas rosea]|uniref:asparagine synthase (glutamine-hydrolyzing) n=2 Tax=Sphingomonas rosea TaxID=335605 RepID=A0ABP7UB98_9SPHN